MITPVECRCQHPHTSLYECSSDDHVYVILDGKISNTGVKIVHIPKSYQNPVTQAINIPTDPRTGPGSNRLLIHVDEELDVSVN